MREAAEIAFAAVLGALLGSFLNVVAHRLPRGESLVHPGSHCPGCGQGIAPYDNVPVLSWLVLRGRCRHCHTRISARYPLIELLTAAAFAAVVAVRGFDSDLLLELPFVAALIALAAIDLEHRILPNRIVYPLAAFAVAAVALLDPGDLPEHLLAGAGIFAFLLLTALAYPAGMGMGDVKLGGAIGLVLGLAALPALLGAFLLGSLVGLAIIAREGAQGRTKAVPFGIFPALGGLIGVLGGPELVELYDERFLS